ncbi:hypothetical protein GCM10009630_52870 [Kribbella jejuensis]|uniref:Uncharacterized protein n=1 Tax=Kribbella jejuensis TaxID=236068 RepID=A0A542ETU1_9ACTN|nr:hypothetical protein [Kribbella jejuensis]TQJ18594.1 hypothetical protein FB475_2740 [Kribbella jejuensis]
MPFLRRRTRLPLTHIADLEPPLPGDELVSVSIGPSGEAVALWAAADAARLLTGDYDAGLLTHPVAVRACLHTPDLCHTVEIPDCGFPFPLAQPMPDGAFLLVGPRVTWRPDGVPPNGTVYDAIGRPIAEGLLGDGIQHVQATESGQVWVGYFDEGVYGNLGWGDGPGTEPIGAPGLIRYTPQLISDWKFSYARHGLPPVDDCEALNVIGETAWCCYYLDFPVMEVRGEAVRAWGNEFQRVTAIAVHQGRVGLYDGKRLVIAGFGSEDLEVERTYNVVLSEGKLPPPTAHIISRGSAIHVFAGRSWYCADLAQLPR